MITRKCMLQEDRPCSVYWPDKNSKIEWKRSLLEENNCIKFKVIALERMIGSGFFQKRYSVNYNKIIVLINYQKDAKMIANQEYSKTSLEHK